MAEAEERIRFINSLGLPPFAHARRRELERFAEACGVDALKRQLDLGAKYHRCCWEAASGEHHPMCAVTRKAAA